MDNYHLSPEAEIEVFELVLYGVDRFGMTEAIKYHTKLEKHFEMLAQSPLLYPVVDYIREGYRRSVCGVHSIYYRLNEDDSIEIMNVIGRQDYRH